jgi:ribosomal protein L12E/L44/L45/RPP1/RPP2
METVLVEWENQRAITLLRELEELNILKILKRNKPLSVEKTPSLAERFAGKLAAADAVSFHQQLKESREE